MMFIVASRYKTNINYINCPKSNSEETASDINKSKQCK